MLPFSTSSSSTYNCSTLPVLTNPTAKDKKAELPSEEEQIYQDPEWVTNASLASVEIEEIAALAANGDAFYQNLAGEKYRDLYGDYFEVTRIASSDLLCAIRESDQLAVHQFIKSSDQGNPSALDNLHNMFLQGRGIDVVPYSRSYVLAFNYLSASASSSPQAKYQFGMLIFLTDPQRAMMLFKEAADAGLARAAHRMVELLYFKEDVKHCLSESTVEECLKKVVDDKELSARSLLRGMAAFVLGEMYQQRIDSSSTALAPNLEESALSYYQLAAKLLSPRIAKQCEFKCLEIAADRILKKEVGCQRFQQEEIEVLYKVGMTYFRGNKDIYVPMDKIKARPYLAMAANQGHPRAAYFFDEYLPSDSSRKLNMKIAEDAGYLPAVLKEQFGRGNVNAAFTLYGLLSSGEPYLDLPPSKEEAAFYLQKAADGECLDAVKEIARLGKVDISANKNLPTRIRRLEEKNNITLTDAVVKLKIAADRVKAPIPIEKSASTIPLKATVNHEVKVAQTKSAPSEGFFSKVEQTVLGWINHNDLSKRTNAVNLINDSDEEDSV